jgi:hypothetical protein
MPVPAPVISARLLDSLLARMIGPMIVSLGQVLLEFNANQGFRDSDHCREGFKVGRSTDI